MTFGVMMGSVQDGGPHEVRMATQGGKWPCKVKMPMQGEKARNGHARRKCLCEVRNGHAR